MSANFSELGLLSLARLAFAADEVLLLDSADGLVLSAGTGASDGVDPAFVKMVQERIAAGEPPLPASEASGWLAFDDKASGGTACIAIRNTALTGGMNRLRLVAGQVLNMHRACRVLAAEHRAVEHSQAVLRGLEKMADVGTWQLDLETGQLAWSDVTYKIHGVTRDETVPTLEDALQFYPDEVRLLVESSIEQAVSKGTGFSFVLPFLRADSELRMVRTIGTVIRHDTGDQLYGILQDITEMKEAELRLWWTANHDALTGLPNRMLFQERLDSALALSRQHGQSVGLILIDLDHFKAINDVYGHEAGDQALTIVAARLSMFTRQGDTLARLGGDEFAIILNGLASPDAIEKPLDRLMAAAEVNFVYRDIPIPVKLSMGAAVFPRDADGERELYRNADLALFRSKADPKRRGVIYQPSHGAEREGREDHLRRIREAIAVGAIAPYFQSMIALDTGTIAAVEVSARKRGAEDEVNALKPAFEDPELALRLGLLTLESLRNGWCSLPPEVLEGTTLSIVVSDQEMRNLAYLEALGRLFGQSRKLGFELVVVLSSNPVRTLPSHVMPAFERLVERGLAFGFDGLAAGFDALLDTTGLRVRQIKASKTTLTDPAVEARAAAIIGGMVETCRRLGVELIATDIATETELRRLRDIGYGCGQGPYFGRAMPFEELREILGADDASTGGGRPRHGMQI